MTTYCYDNFIMALSTQIYNHITNRNQNKPRLKWQAHGLHTHKILYSAIAFKVTFV